MTRLNFSMQKGFLARYIKPSNLYPTKIVLVIIHLKLVYIILFLIGMIDFKMLTCFYYYIANYILKYYNVVIFLNVFVWIFNAIRL